MREASRKAREDRSPSLQTEARSLQPRSERGMHIGLSTNMARQMPAAACRADGWDPKALPSGRIWWMSS
jgi:hypothetical protein